MNYIATDKVGLPGARPDPLAAPKIAAPPTISRRNAPRSIRVMLPAATMGSCAPTDWLIAAYCAPGNRTPWSTKIQPTTKHTHPQRQ